MGMDEHGPAYPEPYSCPICQGDQHCFLSCNHPGCPDGRDPGHPYRGAYHRVGDIVRDTRPRPPISMGLATVLIGAGVIIAVLAYMLGTIR